MQLTLTSCAVRSWKVADVEPLAHHANNYKIWLNLRDAFPHPYTLHDAREFIKSVRNRAPETTFAIAVTDYALATHALTRIYALPFASNAASCRVLEKAGYALEARLRRSAIKNGVVTDQFHYAFVVPESASLSVNDLLPPETRD